MLLQIAPCGASSMRIGPGDEVIIYIFARRIAVPVDRIDALEMEPRGKPQSNLINFVGRKPIGARTIIIVAFVKAGLLIGGPFNGDASGMKRRKPSYDSLDLALALALANVLNVNVCNVAIVVC